MSSTLALPSSDGSRTLNRWRPRHLECSGWEASPLTSECVPAGCGDLSEMKAAMDARRAGARASSLIDMKARTYAVAHQEAS
jgi:hypothetical protein